MAKKSTAKNAPKSSNEKPHNPFGDMKGEKFGGGHNRLMMEENETIHGFVHIRLDPQVKLSNDSDPIDLYVALDSRDGQELRMPASAVFRKNADTAKLNAGDVYSVARLPDTTKKAGKGKGKKMEVWAILVTKRINPETGRAINAVPDSGSKKK